MRGKVVEEKRVFVNDKERETLKRYLDDSIKQIKKEMFSCQEKRAMLMWARLKVDQETLLKFMNKIKGA